MITYADNFLSRIRSSSWHTHDREIHWRVCRICCSEFARNPSRVRLECHMLGETNHQVWFDFVLFLLTLLPSLGYIWYIWLMKVLPYCPIERSFFFFPSYKTWPFYKIPWRRFSIHNELGKMSAKHYHSEVSFCQALDEIIVLARMIEIFLLLDPDKIFARINPSSLCPTFSIRTACVVIRNTFFSYKDSNGYLFFSF